MKRRPRKSEAATGAEGNLSSLVGGGPSPMRQDEDRPAPNGAEEDADEKTAFAANSAQNPANGEHDATAKRAYRWVLLQAFMRAGRAIFSRLARVDGDMTANRSKIKTKDEEGGNGSPPSTDQKGMTKRDTFPRHSARGSPKDKQEAREPNRPKTGYGTTKPDRPQQ